MRIFSRILSLLLLTPLLIGAESGDQVVVIYNRDSSDSREVAEHYASKRSVPKNQLLGLPLSKNETISRKDYLEKLHRPLWKWLVDEKLFIANPPPSQTDTGVISRIRSSKIRYAVLCYDVPLKIAKDPNISETPPARKELARDEASVDNELCLLPLGEKAIPLMGPLSNPLYRSTNLFSFDPTNGMLMVTRLDGPTPAIARGLVDKALEAEANGLWGRGYFDLRSLTNAEYALGDHWIRGAAEITRLSGFDTVVDEGPVTFPATTPMHHVAFYAGWYDDHVSGPFTRNVDFMPGAIAYHLHSFSATSLRRADRHWVGPLLARGATASLGSTEEPYLSGTPDVAVLFAHLQLLGASFGEAAYACMGSISWQTTVVGDPLYRPFGRKHQELHEDLAARKHPRLDWAHARIANLNVIRKSPLVEIVDYLEKEPLTPKSSVLLGKLAEVQQRMDQTNAALASLQKALPLATNRMERLRLKTKLADQLTTHNQQANALRIWRELLQEYPEYFDKVATYRKMLALARESADLEALQALQKEINQLVPTLK